MNKTIFKIRPPFEILPPFKSYQHHSNSLQSQKFPNCCEWHKNVYKVLCDRFESDFRLFAGRVKEETKIELDISDYSDTPTKIVTQLSYTEYYISQTINKLDWYRYFLHCIDYNEYSFGDPSLGSTRYLEMVKLFLESSDDQFDSKKKDILIEELKYRIDTVAEGIKYRSFSNPKLIHETIRKWLKSLPFKSRQLQSFIEDDKWQSIMGIAETNQFDKRIISIVPITKKELIEGLEKLTKTLLLEMKSHLSSNIRDLADIKEHQIKLLFENHNLKQKKLLLDHDRNEYKYLEIMGIWLSNEMQLVKEYKTLLSDSDVGFPDTSKSNIETTFESKLPRKELKLIREKLIVSEIISPIDVNEFLYLFDNKPIFPSMIRLDWLKANSWCYYFLSKIVYTDKHSKFSSKQANNCIIGKKNKLIKSNSNHGAVPEIDEILD